MAFRATVPRFVQTLRVRGADSWNEGSGPAGAAQPPSAPLRELLLRGLCVKGLFPDRPGGEAGPFDRDSRVKT